MLLNRQLTSAEVDFVFFHLAHHLEGFDQLRAFLSYGCPDSASTKVFFCASREAIDLSGSVVVDKVPVLFPLSADLQLYALSPDGSLKFHHDLLKSAFYLLSGYQEWSQRELADQWQRFPYEQSIQYRLGIIHKPLVNYYFQWIIEGLSEFAAFHHIPVKNRFLFGRMGLHLSHDIDLLRYHSFRKVLYRIAQVVGLRRAHIPRKRLFISVADSFLKAFQFRLVQNPYWSFSKILNTERYYGFRSSWYFLPRDGGPFDADYSWHQNDVCSIIAKLKALQNEVGLHGSIRGATDFQLLQQSLDELSAVLGEKPQGIRMHFLALEYPDAFRNFDKLGIAYDCSLGFSRMEGFRFGYCFPFRPFDHHHGRMADTWEIPLLAMDTTLLVHRKLDYDAIYSQLETLLEEVSRFGGIFSILLHNTTFDEYQNPGFLKFYEALHHYFSQYSPISLTGSEIINRMNSLR